MFEDGTKCQIAHSAGGDLPNINMSREPFSPPRQLPHQSNLLLPGFDNRSNVGLVLFSGIFPLQPPAPAALFK